MGKKNGKSLSDLKKEVQVINQDGMSRIYGGKVNGHSPSNLDRNCGGIVPQ